MSCLNNIDPYNNAPPPRPGGGGCGGGSCGSKPSANQQYSGPPVPQMEQLEQVPQYTGPQPQTGRTTGMSQRPMQTPGRPDLQTENQLLMTDLQTAIQYIQQLGGTWPPPGH